MSHRRKEERRKKIANSSFGKTQIGGEVWLPGRHIKWKCLRREGGVGKIESCINNALESKC
jgi:hypothetical protein